MIQFSDFGRAKRLGNSARRMFILLATVSVVVGCQASDSRKPTVAVDQAKPANINPALLDYADRSIQAGKHDEAKSILEQMMVVDPKHARVRLLVAELQLATGAKRAALQIFSQLTRIPELAARAYQGMGIVHLLEGRGDKGFRALTESVEIDPGHWRAWNALGFYHDSKGRWEKANQSYTKALSANPHSAIVYSNRGYSRILSGNVDDALLDLVKAVELDPELEIARINLRIALAWKGRYREALLGVEEREKGTAFNNVGFIALMRGDRDTAEIYFREAMKLDATFNETAWRNLGYLKNLNSMGADADKNL